MLFFFIQVHYSVKKVTKWMKQQEVRVETAWKYDCKFPSSDICQDQMRMLAGVLHLKQIPQEGKELKVGDHHCELSFHHCKPLFK